MLDIVALEVPSIFSLDSDSKMQIEHSILTKIFPTTWKFATRLFKVLTHEISVRQDDVSIQYLNIEMSDHFHHMVLTNNQLIQVCLKLKANQWV